MNMNSKAFIGIIIPVIFLSLSYGILVGAYEFFPYDQISQIKEITFDEFRQVEIRSVSILEANLNVKAIKLAYELIIYFCPLLTEKIKFNLFLSCPIGWLLASTSAA